MAVPEVDKRLLEELEEMGFPLARATRALHFSGNSGLEDAINWIVDHENDSDIDRMPLVPMDIDLDASKPFPITEEVMIKAQKLRNGANQMTRQKEKELESEREKERIKTGKKILEAKRTVEENARKRMIALKEAEKEEEKRARKRIRQKLEADKASSDALKECLEVASEDLTHQLILHIMAERRSKLGIPPVFSSSTQPAFHVVQKNSAEISKPVKLSQKAELLSDCLRSLKRCHKDKDVRVKKAFQTLQIYIRNVMTNPEVERFRKIRLSNPVFQERVGSLTGGVEFLELSGFERTNDGQFLYLPRDKVDMETLNSAMSALHSAITNPFFGLLSVELLCSASQDD